MTSLRLRFESSSRLKGSRAAALSVLTWRYCRVNRKVLIMPIYIKQEAQWGQYGLSTSALFWYFMSPSWAWRVRERRRTLKDLIKQSEMRVPRCQAQDRTQIRRCWQCAAVQCGFIAKATYSFHVMSGHTAPWFNVFYGSGVKGCESQSHYVEHQLVNLGILSYLCSKR